MVDWHTMPRWSACSLMGPEPVVSFCCGTRRSPDIRHIVQSPLAAPDPTCQPQQDCQVFRKHWLGGFALMEESGDKGLAASLHGWQNAHGIFQKLHNVAQAATQKFSTTLLVPPAFHRSVMCSQAHCDLCAWWLYLRVSTVLIQMCAADFSTAEAKACNAALAMHPGRHMQRRQSVKQSCQLMAVLSCK